MSNLNALVSNNSQPVAMAVSRLSASVSNLNEFTVQLPPLANSIGALVKSNEAGINNAVKNLEASSVSLTNIMTDLQNGRGTAGRLLRDEELARNLSAIAQNLSVTTSNLNQRGLWGILWKQKVPPPPKTKSPAKSK
jgi:phospholipid/cholesterol/gamma-HCH transport system substrate-binding protein